MATETEQTDEPEEKPLSINKRTKAFRESYDKLPERIQKLGIKIFEQFKEDPSHTALRHHQLKDTHRGQHKPGSYSVSINMQYRAIYFIDNRANIWYWVGSHSEYDKFTGNV